MLDSQATRAIGVWVRDQSRMASEIASHTLSGWPSVTLSELHRNLGALWKLVVNSSSLSQFWNREYRCCSQQRHPDPAKGAQAALNPRCPDVVQTSSSGWHTTKRPILNHAET